MIRGNHVNKKKVRKRLEELKAQYEIDVDIETPEKAYTTATAIITIVIFFTKEFDSFIKPPSAQATIFPLYVVLFLSVL